MSDAVQGLTELKREIIEARNQAIKTDNQVKNLSLDIKGFEKRFDSLEKRVRISSIGVNVIVAVTIALASYAVSALRAKEYDKTIDALRGEVRAVEEAAEDKIGRLEEETVAREAYVQQRQQTQALLLRIVTSLDEKKEKNAAEALEKLDDTKMTELEGHLLRDRLDDLRHRTAENFYRNARTLLAANKRDAALEVLGRCIKIEPEGRFSGLARYLLATNLWTAQRWDEAVQILKEIRQREKDKSVQEEARYLLAVALARLGQAGEAKELFDRIAQAGGRYERSAKAFLAAIDEGGALPDLPASRPRASATP